MSTQVIHEEEVGRAALGRVTVTLKRESHLNSNLTEIQFHCTRTAHLSVHGDSTWQTVALDIEQARDVRNLLDKAIQMWTKPLDLEEE
jgi:hypothetical protein